MIPLFPVELKPLPVLPQVLFDSFGEQKAAIARSYLVSNIGQSPERVYLMPTDELCVDRAGGNKLVRNLTGVFPILLGTQRTMGLCMDNCLKQSSTDATTRKRG
ncbi:hypothetical protein Tco_0844610 [Tanacetum coccineum]